MAEIIQLPEGGGSASGAGNIPFSIPIGGFSGNGGFNGNGQTNLMDLLGFAIIASIFPNFFGGRGNQGQFSGMDSELAIQAVTAQGDASRTAIQTLASSIGQDFNIVYGAVSNVQNILQNIAMQQATSVPQIINAIQSGNTALASQFCQCCCEQKLLTHHGAGLSGTDSHYRADQPTRLAGRPQHGEHRRRNQCLADQHDQGVL